MYVLYTYRIHINYIVTRNTYKIHILKYIQNKSIFNKIVLISKPGKRVYVKNKWFYTNKQPGTFILSTSHGFATHFKSQELNIGGELICQIL